MRDRLHGLVLKARPLLIGEARDLLQGVYGLGADGWFVPPARLPVVQMLAEARITRVRLETFIADEVAAGLTPGCRGRRSPGTPAPARRRRWGRPGAASCWGCTWSKGLWTYSALRENMLLGFARAMGYCSQGGST